MNDQNSTIQTPREATAVVEYTSDQAVKTLTAGQHQTRILNSFDQEAKNAAIAVIERYATTNSEGNVVLGAKLVDFETLAVQLARTSSYSFGRVLADVKNDARRYQSNGFIASVQLDLNGESWEADAGSEDETERACSPIVMFCDLPRTAPSFKAGECEALAFFYLPTQTFRDVVKYGWRTGQVQLRPSTREAEGFIGIARTFTDHDAAREAASDLARARSAYHYQCRMEANGPEAKTGADRVEAIEAAQAREVRKASF